MAASPTPELEITRSETETPAVQKPKFARLTPEYRKAHKNYVLIAGLLASWELIGINLQTKEKWGIELTSPKAIPLILYALLIYSAYKVIIEWAQLDEEHPKTRAAQVDFWVAHALAAGAVLIGLIQAMLKIRIAEVLGTNVFAYMTAVMIGLVGASFFLYPLAHFMQTARMSRTIWMSTGMIVSLGIGIAVFHKAHWKGVFWLLISFVVGAFLSLILNRWFRNWIKSIPIRISEPPPSDAR